MSMSISPVSTAAIQLESQQSAPAAKTNHQASAGLPHDTVTLSSAAQKAPQGGDVDHDGDSH